MAVGREESHVLGLVPPRRARHAPAVRPSLEPSIVVFLLSAHEETTPPRGDGFHFSV
jgi:hypothetical protein